MEATADTLLLHEHLIVLFFAAFMGAIISWIAWKEGYYDILPQDPAEGKKVSWKHTLMAFAIFLCIELFIVPSFYILWLYFKGGVPIVLGTPVPHPDQVTQGWINMLAIAGTGLALAVYFCTRDSEVRRQIWGRKPFESTSRTIGDLLMGVVSWLVAYPWIIALSQLVAILLQFSYKGPHVDQIAVKQVREAMAHPVLLWITIFSIVAIVPVIEELLFRGFLQTWLKGLFGRTKAIFATALIFALFHFSVKQGAENFELITSLFVLACFLGYVRERRQSLWASIGLHSTFNIVSILMIVETGINST